MKFYFIFQCQCGSEVQTRSVTCLGSDGNFSDKCEEEKPPTERQCKDPCLHNLEERGGSNKWVTGVDEGDGDSRITHSDNLNHLAEFLEIPNCCSEIQGLIYLVWIPMLQCSLNHIYRFYIP